MRIVIVTQYYPPDPPSWIPAGVAHELAARGHDVKVLTTFPHYETGRIAAGYRQKLRHVEQDGAVVVRRVPIFASHSGNALARVVNYVSLAVSMRLARGFVKNVDVAYVYSTPMTVAEAPRVWARSLKLPFVLHVQDLWPESVTGSGFLPQRLGGFVDGLLTRWLRRVYRRAAITIGIAPTMKDMLIERGVDRERSAVVLNWSNDSDGVTPARQPSRAPGLHLIYAGNIGRMQDLPTIVKAAALLKDLPGLQIRIAGSGIAESELKDLVRELEVESIEFLGRLSVDEVSDVYARSDFQLVTLKDLEIFDGTLPSKFQAGLANGLPVISTVRGDMRTMVEEGELGFVAEPENARSLAASITQAYDTTVAERKELSRRARSYYDEHMSKRSGVDAIEALLVEAAKVGRR